MLPECSIMCYLLGVSYTQGRGSINYMDQRRKLYAVVLDLGGRDHPQYTRAEKRTFNARVPQCGATTPAEVFAYNGHRPGSRPG